MENDDFNQNSKAIDLATHTIFQDEAAIEESKEVTETIKELVTYFGKPAIAKACYDLEVIDSNTAASSERTLQTLRAYSVLILDSNRPMLTAQLVGKLAGLEISTGKRLILSEIGKAWGISKQAVSKRLAAYAERLNLPRPDSTENARKSHRLMNKRNYSNNITEKAHATI